MKGSILLARKVSIFVSPKRIAKKPKRNGMQRIKKQIFFIQTRTFDAKNDYTKAERNGFFYLLNHSINRQNISLALIFHH